MNKVNRLRSRLQERKRRKAAIKIQSHARRVAGAARFARIRTEEVSELKLIRPCVSLPLATCRNLLSLLSAHNRPTALTLTACPVLLLGQSTSRRLRLGLG